MANYQVIREYPGTGERETAGYMHGAPEKDSKGWDRAFVEWVRAYCKGDPGGCGYEAVRLQDPDPWTGLYIPECEMCEPETPETCEWCGEEV